MKLLVSSNHLASLPGDACKLVFEDLKLKCYNLVEKANLMITV